MKEDDTKIKHIRKMKKAIESLSEDDLEEINNLAFEALRVKDA